MRHILRGYAGHTRYGVRRGGIIGNLTRRHILRGYTPGVYEWLHGVVHHGGSWLPLVAHSNHRFVAVGDNREFEQAYFEVLYPL